MKDILLGADGDIRVTDTGDIVLTDSVRQAIRIRLLWFFDEWRFAPTLGVPYFEVFFVKNPNILRLRQVIRDEIMTVDEVTDVPDVEIQVDPQTRRAKIGYVAAVAQQTFRDEVIIDA